MEKLNSSENAVCNDIYTTFTHYIDRENAQKKSVWLDENGKLASSNVYHENPTYEGFAHKTRISFDEFSSFLKSEVTENSFIMPTVFDGKANSIKAMTNSGFEADGFDVISREQNHFHFGDSEILAVFDVDFPAKDALGYCENENLIADTCKGVADQLRRAVKELSHVRMVVKQSSNGFLYNGDKEVSGARYHVFVPVRSKKDLLYFSDELFKKLILAGLGWVKIIRSGDPVIETFIDKNMFKDAQALFVNLASIKDERITQVDKGIYDTLDGGYFVAGDEFTDSEKAKYEEIIVHYKAQCSEKCEKKRKEWLKRRLESKGIKATASALEKEEKKCKRLIDNQEAHGDQIVKFHNGDILTVQELLKQQEKYHKKYCWDLIDQDDTQKAMFFKETRDCAANIFSHAHGGKQYTFSHYFARHNKKLTDESASISADEYANLFRYCTKEDGRNKILKSLIAVFSNKSDGVRKYITASAGFGKTQICLDIIAGLFIDQFKGVEQALKFKDVRIDYFVGNHDLADEMVKRWNEIVEKRISKEDDSIKGELRKRLTAKHIRGREHLCQHSVVKNLKDKSIVDKNFCKGFGFNAVGNADKFRIGKACDHLENCEYLQQRNEASCDDVIHFMVHDYLFTEVYMDKRDANVLIVDEDIINSKILDDSNSMVIQKGNYSFSDKIIEQCENGISVYEAVQLNREELQRKIAEKLGELEGIKRGNSSLEEITKMISDRNELRQFISALKTLSEITKEQRNIWYLESEKCLKISKMASFRAEIRNKAMLFLDGTGSEAVIKKSLGCDTEVVDIKVKTADSLKVVQNVSQNFAKSNFDYNWNKYDVVNQNVDEVVKRIGNFCTEQDGIITYAILEGKLEKKVDNKILHFGKLRGTDVFEDRSKILIIGRYKLSDEAIESMSRMLFWDESDLSFEKQYEKTYYYMKDGQHKGCWARGYKDSRVRELQYHIEEAEMLQAIGRIRGIHSKMSKTVEIWTKEAFRIELDEIVEAGEENVLESVVQEYGILKYKDNAEIERLSGLKVNQFRNVKDKESDAFKVLLLKVKNISRGRNQDVAFFIANSIEEQDYDLYLRKIGYEYRGMVS
ncbi:hypothetical protein [Desulfopila sp. IMCC35008]|uniref:hypothetical protein n=1 Tax=Desulfopila sp. IMCC35008 TaxID=2653858 RepID=UPI0013D4E7EB|nr:hypothetical protein [Desulfopila sp. IMCC35008]